ncbi:MAG: hypothetical protein PHY48_10470 [Candidatus Cloacimonetes bacterium]|nr:hypothetical protein [Candidatus Cloacimonadota bacterium]
MKLPLDISRQLTKTDIDDIKNKKPISGFCVMADVVGSTEIKYNVPFSNWCINLHNTLFRFHDYSFEGVVPVLKTVGDELMYFIESDPEPKIANKLMNMLITAAENFEPDLRSNIKIAITYSNDIYDVSFTPIVSVDYYGKGIDLTARMASVAENRIVCNEEFHNLLQKTVEKKKWMMMLEPLEVDPEKMKGISPLPVLFQYDVHKYLC